MRIKKLKNDKKKSKNIYVSLSHISTYITFRNFYNVIKHKYRSQASEPEVAEQPAEPISGYYRSEPQQVKAQPAHRFAAPRPQQAGSKASALGYATAPTNAPILYQAYQQ